MLSVDNCDYRRLQTISPTTTTAATTIQVVGLTLPIHVPIVSPER